MMRKLSDERIQSIIDEFDIDGSLKTFERFGGGHINETFRLFNSNNVYPDYLLQRVNHHVFYDVPKMMKNIQLVIEHISQKSPNSTTLKLIRTKQGASFYQDDDGDYWRIFDFKKNTKTYDVVRSTDQAYQGAKAFGSFLYQMSDFDAQLLYPSIPDFHNLLVRLDQLTSASLTATTSRKSRAKDALKTVFSESHKLSEIERLKNIGKIPMRVTHNDTKFNNVLLDEKGQAYCVIDLDTVMPGIVHYDFGDGIRTSTSMSKEDEKDLKNIHFDIAKYEAFTQGYLDGVRGILSELELKYFPLSAAMITYMIGVRFLTDYLNNDIYYKIAYEDQNYYRAMCQLELARQIMGRHEELGRVIKRINVHLQF